MWDAIFLRPEFVVFQIMFFFDCDGEVLEPSDGPVLVWSLVEEDASHWFEFFGEKFCQAWIFCESFEYIGFLGDAADAGCA